MITESVPYPAMMDIQIGLVWTAQIVKQELLVRDTKGGKRGGTRGEVVEFAGIVSGGREVASVSDFGLLVPSDGS